MKTRQFSTVLTASALAIGMSATVVADANWRRFSAANCTPDSADGDFRFDHSYGTGMSLFSTSAIPAAVACPVDEDSYLWVDSVTSISVNVTNVTSGGGISARACVLYDQAVGGSCGTAANATSIGHQTLSPSTSVWNQTWFGETYAGDYPYLLVTMSGPTAIGDRNSLRGYHIQ